MIVETAGRLALALLRFELQLVLWAVLFPMLSAPVVLTALAWRAGGTPAATAVAAASLMILIGWRLGWSESFRRLVTGRIWKRWRRWTIYRRPWRHLCAMHGLTVVLNEHVSIPPLHRVKVGYSSDALTVRMLYGQSLDNWLAVSDALAHAFGALSVSIRTEKPGWILGRVPWSGGNEKAVVILSGVAGGQATSSLWAPSTSFGLSSCRFS